MSSTKESAILKHAREVLKSAEKLVEYLEKNGHEEPSFKPDSAKIPEDNEYNKLRTPLNESAETLLHLVNGPTNWIRSFCVSHQELAGWQVALRLNFFEALPLGKTATTAELAKTVKMDEDRLERIMKLLTTQNCFHEVEDGVFEHTAMSAQLAQDKDLQAVFGFQADEMFEASPYTADVVQKEPYKSDAMNSAFALHNGIPPYQWYGEHPEKAARFASAMAGYVKMNRDTQELRERFPWKSLSNKKVVDVGGGSGHISIYLAHHFPDLQFVVQDVNPDMLSQGPKREDFAGLQDRVSFMQYDFNDPQPVNDAGLFLLRQIAHNYNDETCIRLFKSFVPAMEQCAPGTGLLINDMLLPAANTKTKFEERGLRQIDMCMLTGYGAKQRSEKEFLTLLKAADPRFEIVKIHGEGVMGLVEVQLQNQSKA